MAICLYIYSYIIVYSDIVFLPFSIKPQKYLNECKNIILYVHNSLVDTVYLSTPIVFKLLYLITDR